MNYKFKKLPKLGPRDGFCIVCPDERGLWDYSPVTIVKELNKLLRRIQELEKEAKP